MSDAVTTETEILLPIGEKPAGESGRAPVLAPRLDTLEDKVVGIVSNGWNCMRVLAEQYSSSLTLKYKLRGVAVYETPATMAMTPELVERIRNECDAVIVGIGN
jgi:hypothetical protein